MKTSKSLRSLSLLALCKFSKSDLVDFQFIENPQSLETEADISFMQNMGLKLWSEWSACSQSCDGGTRSKVQCFDPDNTDCTIQPGYEAAVDYQEEACGEDPCGVAAVTATITITMTTLLPYLQAYSDKTSTETAQLRFDMVNFLQTTDIFSGNVPSLDYVLMAMKFRSSTDPSGRRKRRDTGKVEVELTFQVKLFDDSNADFDALLDQLVASMIAALQTSQTLDGAKDSTYSYETVMNEGKACTEDSDCDQNCMSGTCACPISLSLDTDGSTCIFVPQEKDEPCIPFGFWSEIHSACMIHASTVEITSCNGENGEIAMNYEVKKEMFEKYDANFDKDTQPTNDADTAYKFTRTVNADNMYPNLAGDAVVWSEDISFDPTRYANIYISSPISVKGHCTYPTGVIEISSDSIEVSKSAKRITGYASNVGTIPYTLTTSTGYWIGADIKIYITPGHPDLFWARPVSCLVSKPSTGQDYTIFDASSDKMCNEPVNFQLLTTADTKGVQEASYMMFRWDNKVSTENQRITCTVDIFAEQPSGSYPQCQQ